MLEKINVAMKIEDWKGLTERARERLRGLYVEFSAYCQDHAYQKGVVVCRRMDELLNIKMCFPR